MNEIKSRPLGQVAIMVASHNEETVKFAVREYNFQAYAFTRILKNK